MIPTKTVLVLGAGASEPYGLPLGWQLKKRILALKENEIRQLPIGHGASRREGDAEAFLQAFRGSHDRSIDAFLARNDRFVDIGIHAIASVLLPCEQDEHLLFNEPEDHWLQYLLDAMEAPWDGLSENPISFITFNYDRSLERFLTFALASRHGRSEDDARALLDHFPIVHVYGRLGSLNPKDRDYVPFGGRDGDRGHLTQAAQGINIIAQGRDDSPAFTEARKLLSEADALCFLGFAFDDANVDRLGGQAICRRPRA